MTPSRRQAGLGGPLTFVLLAVGLTWLAALFCDLTWVSEAESSSSRLLRASVLFVVIVGWQPVIALWIVRRHFADTRELDDGFRTASGGFSFASITVPLVLLVASAGLDAQLWRSVDIDRVDPGESWAGAASATFAFCGMVAVLWIQAVTEELAWRGYVLTRLMRRLGAWPGLVLHGMLWGLWYAPVFLVTGGADSVTRIASFVVTGALLGTLLGWMRLASRSIFASAASNTMLTLCGGLPLVLQGASPALAAVYEPVGWIPMLALVVLIAARSSLRAAVTVPYRPIPEHVN